MSVVELSEARVLAVLTAASTPRLNLAWARRASRLAEAERLERRAQSLNMSRDPGYPAARRAADVAWNDL